MNVSKLDFSYGNCQCGVNVFDWALLFECLGKVVRTCLVKLLEHSGQAIKTLPFFFTHNVALWENSCHYGGGVAMFLSFHRCFTKRFK